MQAKLLVLYNDFCNSLNTLNFSVFGDREKLLMRHPAKESDNFSLWSPFNQNDRLKPSVKQTTTSNHDSIPNIHFAGKTISPEMYMSPAMIEAMSTLNYNKTNLKNFTFFALWLYMMQCNNDPYEVYHDGPFFRIINLRNDIIYKREFSH